MKTVSDHCRRPLLLLSGSLVLLAATLSPGAPQKNTGRTPPKKAVPIAETEEIPESPSVRGAAPAEIIVPQSGLTPAVPQVSAQLENGQFAPISAAQIEVRFPGIMIDPKRINEETDAAQFVEIKPALPGKFRWRSTQGGTLLLTALPQLGRTYTFQVKGGLKDAAGKSVGRGEVVSVTAPPLTITHYTPRWFSEGSANRTPAVTVFFNDTVTATGIAQAAYFIDKDGQRISAAALNPLGTEVSVPGNIRTGSWSDQHTAAAAADPKLPIASAVTIKPAQPLPIGKAWSLVLPAGVANQAGQARLPGQFNLAVGTVSPMLVANVQAEPVLDGERQLHVWFSKKLPELKPADIARYVTVKPLPKGVKVELSGTGVTYSGGFEVGRKYEVNVAAGVPALDGLTLETPVYKEVVFAAHEPHISLPAFANAQWIGGRGDFEFTSANLSDVVVRVKKVSASGAAFALSGYRIYESDPSREDGGNTRVPYEAVPGKTVLEKTLPTTVGLDHSERFNFKWDDVGGGKRQPGIYFVSVEGKPKSEVSSSTRLGAQALVTLTDIGLAWKYNSTEALIYAFSHTTGQPLPDIKLTAVGEEGDSFQEVETGKDGTAMLDLDKARWLLASNAGGDLHGVKFDSHMPALDMWSFDLPYTSREEQKSWREVCFFSDRPVYQPGETVFFKAIQRMHDSKGISLPPDGKAKLSLYDPQNRLLSRKDVIFSDAGSLNDIMRLPERVVGYYRLSLDFRPPAPVAKKKDDNAPVENAGEEEAEGEEEFDGEEGGRGQMVFEHNVFVQEYQPNSFKISFDAAQVKREGDNASVPVRAAYLMGKPLSEAELKWTSEISMAGFVPAQWPDYRFCHARSYYVWDGQDYHSLDEEAWRSPLLTGQDSVKLSAKGEATIDAKMPSDFGVPGPKSLTVTAEITDINQQTISDTFVRTEQSSQFYIGVRRERGAIRANEQMPLDVVAVLPDGKRMSKPVEAKLLVEHLTWNAVREQTAGGGTDVKNELIFAKVGEYDLTLSPELGKERAFVFKPGAAGTHNLTFTARDADGAEVRTVISVDVFGADDMTWRQDDGVKIELVTDKDSYLPGDTARIVVKSPIKGTALVTVERDSVLQSEVQALDAGGAISIRVQEEWAPNVFVSVLHIRGGADDPRQHRSPDYRVGFCELKVESKRHRLAVELTPTKADVRPGEMIEVTATVKDSSGKPVPDAELALWASDEGILTLLPWEAPQPYDTFHYQQSLFVTTGTSLERLLSENPEELDFSNKGFVIGGGGFEGANVPLRKNFQATAFWQGDLKTGADGKVTVTFPAPDNLTAFRLVGVASEGVTRFGTGEGKVTVSKPLMLEPALPRFANVGDDITLVAVLHNNTDRAAEVKVDLVSDEHAKVLDESGKPLAGGTRTKSVALAARQSRGVAFPVKFAADGEAVLQWKATGPDAELTDAVQSKIGIGFAEPQLRELLFPTLTDAGNAQNLLAKVRPEVLEGSGDVRVTISNSRLIQAAEAINQLLHYPYGCAEQTSSSMIPWLAVNKLRGVIPGIERTDKEINLAVTRGVDRLLSMQTPDGGIGYWPGQETGSLWASAHACIALNAAKEGGFEVPEQRFAQLRGWISKQLRSDKAEEAPASESWEMMERCYACWALTSAGEPEAAYHAVLYDQKDSLTTAARSLLALSIAVGGGDAAQAKELLGMADNGPGEWWLGGESLTAIRAMTLMELKDAGSDQEMSRLFAQRSPRGDWRHTFNNAWVLMAALRESATSGWKGGQPVVLQFAGAQPVSLNLPEKAASEMRSFPRAAGGAKPALTVTMPAGQKLFAQVEVTGRAVPGTRTTERAQGFAVSRTWQEVATDGTLAAPDNLEVGDLVLVTLGVQAADSAEYVVIDDPLPATFEGVNPEFTSMVGGRAADAAAANWASDFSEVRRDRMLFFSNYLEAAGRFRVQYLARVVAEGTVTVPPTRVEMMYDPARFGHSPSDKVSTRRAAGEEMAGR